MVRMTNSMRLICLYLGNKELFVGFFIATAKRQMKINYRNQGGMLQSMLFP
jgi:hypothetical protein